MMIILQQKEILLIFKVRKIKISYIFVFNFLNLPILITTEKKLLDFALNFDVSLNQN